MPPPQQQQRSPGAGDRIAFERDGGIYVAPLAAPARTLRIGQGQDPNLSPDSAQIAFEEATPDGSERRFAVRDAASGRLLRRHAGVVPHFSPDGAWIAFSRFNGSAWTAWVADAALAHPRPLGNGARNAPAWIGGWTDSGLLITYAEELGGPVYALRPATGEIVRSVTLSKIAGGHDLIIPVRLAWSEDLKRLVFEAQTDEEMRGDDPGPLQGLFLYDFGTKRLRQITPRGLDGSAPVWLGPSQIAFTGIRNDGRLRRNVYTLDLGTGALRLLIPNAQNAAFPAHRGGGSGGAKKS